MKPIENDDFRVIDVDELLEGAAEELSYVIQPPPPPPPKPQIDQASLAQATGVDLTDDCPEDGVECPCCKMPMTLENVDMSTLPFTEYYSCEACGHEMSQEQEE